MTIQDRSEQDGGSVGEGLAIPGLVAPEKAGAPVEHLAYEVAAVSSPHVASTWVRSCAVAACGLYLVAYAAYCLGAGTLDWWSFLPLLALGGIFVVWGAHEHGVMRGQRHVFDRWRTSLDPAPAMPHTREVDQ